jgi:hypothetical protein
MNETNTSNTSNTSIEVCVSVCSGKLEEESEAADAFDQVLEVVFSSLFVLSREIT